MHNNFTVINCCKWIEYKNELGIIYCRNISLIVFTTEVHWKSGKKRECY